MSCKKKSLAVVKKDNKEQDFLKGWKKLNPAPEGINQSEKEAKVKKASENLKRINDKSE